MTTRIGKVVKNILLFLLTVIAASATSVAAKYTYEVNPLKSFAIVIPFLLLLFFWKKGDTAIKRMGLLLWVISYAFFLLLILWQTFNSGTGKSLFGFRTDNNIFVYSLWGMGIALLVQLSIPQRMHSLALAMGSCLMQWIKIGK